MKRTPRWSHSLSAALAVALVAPAAALANPSGGVVRAGNASISGQGTAQVDVQQQSRGAVFSWQSFNIQAHEVTNFHQPDASSVALNRILDQNASQILGSLNANGHVYLINPNGILFGKTAQVNVHSLTASTSLDGDDLIAVHGFDPRAHSAPDARIENQGTIRAGDGGVVYLVAPQVENGSSGVITAPDGEVRIEPGATVYLTSQPLGGLAIAYTAPGEPGGEAVNLGRIVADGGLVRLRAALVHQGGEIEADSVRERAGAVELYAGHDLRLASGSRTSARGGDTGVSAGGRVDAWSDGDAVVEDGARIDVSGGAQGGDGGAAEISARHALDLSGSYAAGAAAGYRGGVLRFDPESLTLRGVADFSGVTGGVRAEAQKLIAIASGAEIRLQDSAAAGSPDPDRPRLTLRSGRHVVFGQGARIVDDGGDGTRRWDVDVVAGADLASADPLALAAGSDGGVYLGGASLAAGSYDVTAVGRGNGEIALTGGDLRLRSAGDVWIGDGGGLRNLLGLLDVRAGIPGSGRGSVLFSAGDRFQDGVIENGSGAIRVIAEDSVRLRADATRIGNAAIRTRGVPVLDALGQPTQGREHAGEILVVARNGDVDAGIGNRWVEPGPAFDATDPVDVQNVLDPVFPGGYPVAETLPAFDPMPVVAEGILGIGSEAGGRVTVIAGRDVTTDALADPQHLGATATDLGTQYGGSRIGVFGQETDEYSFKDPTLGVFLNAFGSLRRPIVPREGAPLARLTVVAGRNLTGDYMARHGTAVLRAGYADAAGGVSDALIDGISGGVGALDGTTAGLAAHASAVDAHLHASAAVSDPGLDAVARVNAGWVGTLAKPITVDLMHASVDLRGHNGVALRGIENPSLVYPPQDHDERGLGDRRAPTYGAGDTARIEAETGDVVLLGVSTQIPQDSTSPPVANDLVRLLPPSVEITTHEFQREGESRGGDLVLLNDFLLFPSVQGGLTLNLAGAMRSTGVAAQGHALLSLNALAAGAAGDEDWSLPAGTVVEDPATGVRFTLGAPLVFQSRHSEALGRLPATGKLRLTFSRGFGDEGIAIAPGTRFVALDGQVYVAGGALLKPIELRLSEGTVTFFTRGRTSSNVVIPKDTQLVAPNGQLFRTVADAGILPGSGSVAVRIEALAPGQDAPTGAMQLGAGFEVAGLAGVQLRLPTTRVVTSLDISVSAVAPGVAGNALPSEINRMLDPIAGVVAVSNPGFFGNGRDDAEFGQAAGGNATTEVVGPLGIPAGNLRLVSVPGGRVVTASGREIDLAQIAEIGVEQVVSPIPTRVPVALRELAIDRDASGQITRTRPDPASGKLTLVELDQVWVGDGSGGDLSPGIRQSDAAPSFDGRNGRINGDGNFVSYASYYTSCRSGHACAVQDPNLGTTSPLRLGTGPTHLNDRSPALLRATGGFSHVSLDLVESVSLETQGDLVDLSLLAQNNSPADVSVVSVPDGSARLGSDSSVLIDDQLGRPIEVRVPGDATSGIQLAGPGRGLVLVGVVPFAEADTNHDGFVTDGDDGSPDEFFGPRAVFDGLDQRGLATSSLADKKLTLQEAAYLPSASTRPHEIRLAARSAREPALGIESIGNLRGAALPDGGAKLDVIAGGDIRLGDAGAIVSLQGGDVFVQSLGGGIFGGNPNVAVSDPPKRGIVSAFVTGSGANLETLEQGGGAIRVDSHADFDIQRAALATLSGSDITVESLAGSVRAGEGAEISDFHVEAGVRSPTVTYRGAGIFAAGTGNVNLVAKQDIDIGAGIRGNDINVTAGQNVNAGTGGLAGTGNVSVTGISISGSISAGGNATFTGSVSSGSSVSAGGIATGAGATASNSRASSDLQQAGESGARSFEGSGTGRLVDSEGRKGVIISVSSTEIESDDDDPKRRHG